MRAAGAALRALGQAYAQPACEAVLHPEDVIASSLQIPALPKARQAAAVRSVLEPMILGDMDDLAIGHGPRAADGSVALAWTPREPLRRAWALLGEHGLRVRALIAPQTLEPVADAPLREPGDPRWQAAAPSWSLATPQWAPTRVSRWRPVWRWTAIACAIWLGGLNLYATQLRGEARSLQTQMREQVQKAYPRLPVVLDPARQARQELDALLARQGSSSAGDFLPLARATAQAMPFAADRVARLLRRPRPHADPGRCRRAGAARGRNARAGATSRRAGPETRTRRQGRHLAHHARPTMNLIDKLHASWRASQQRYAPPSTAPAKAGRRWRRANAGWSCAPAPCWAPRWSGRC